jgi:trigger factor
VEIQLDQISKTEALIKINLKESDYQPKVEEKLKEYSKKAQIKGFRTGKVPKGVIQRMYGKSILAEEINHMVSHKLTDYIKENNLNVLGDPLPNMEKMEALDWDNASEFDFEYEVGMPTPFELKIDNKFKVDTLTVKIDDKLMEETMDNLKEQFGEMTNPDTSSEGDSIYGNILSDEAAEDEQGSLLNLKEVDQKILKSFLDKKAGDVIEFDPSKALKDDTQRNTFLGKNKETKGKIKFEVKNINRTVPAVINQELFDKTFGKDIVKTEEEFLSKIKDSVAENYSKETDGYTEMKIREKFLEKTKVQLPDEFLKRWLKQSNQNELSDEQIEKEYPLYAEEMKCTLVKNKISEDNDIKTTHEEIVNEAKVMIRAQFGSMGMSDAMEENINSFADNYLQAEEGQNYRKLSEKVFHDKILSFLKENITLKSKEVTAKEYRDKA